MKKNIKMPDRNRPLGLVDRTMRNLCFIEENRKHGAKVHEVTQLVLSLLGLVIFPKEASVFNESDFGPYLLSGPELKDWPKWRIDSPNIQTLEHLLVFIRHAAAHRRIRFSSDAPSYDHVHLYFKNRTNSGEWQRANISARDLREFCGRLAQLLTSTHEQ